MKRKILIYRSRLLPISETFVLDHYRSLTQFDPVFGAIKRVSDGVNLAGASSLVLSDVDSSRLTAAKFLLDPARSVLFRQIRDLSPALIHAHFALDACDMVPIASALRIPLVVTLHGFDVNVADKTHLTAGPLGWRYLTGRKNMLHQTSLFLPVSNFVKINALRKGFPPAKTKLHFLGIDLSMFGGSNVADRSGVLFVGRLVEKKGAQYLLRAMASLKDMGVSVPLTIVGDGPLMPELSRLAADLGVSARFLGSQPRSVVRELMGKSLLQCMPSVEAASGDNEGLPIVALEAQASGCPVIAFNQGPMPGAIVHLKTGLLVENKNVVEFAAAMRSLLGDPGLAKSMGVAGMAHVAENFDIRQQSAILESYYTQLIERVHGGN